MSFFHRPKPRETRQAYVGVGTTLCLLIFLSCTQSCAIVLLLSEFKTLEYLHLGLSHPRPDRVPRLPPSASSGHGRSDTTLPPATQQDEAIIWRPFQASLRLLFKTHEQLKADQEDQVVIGYSSPVATCTLQVRQALIRTLLEKASTGLPSYTVRLLATSLTHA